MSLLLRRAIAAWLFAVGVSGASETLIGDVGATRFPGNQGAYGGSLTLQSASQSGGFLVGVSGTDYPIGSLTVGSLDGYLMMPSAVMVSAGVAVGDAAANAESNTLYKAHVGVDWRFASTWAVNAADQYIDLDVIHGHLMNVGVQYRPDLKWDVGATIARALSGTLADRYGQLTANWYGPQHIFGGAILGRSGYDPADLGSSSVIRRLLEFYVGVGVPVRAATFTITADNTSLEGAARQTLRIGFTEPIKP